MRKPLGLLAALFLTAAACTATPPKDEGTVKDEGQVCGGIRGLPCPEGQFCDLPAGECQGADLQGVCVPQTPACTKEYRPVCGCDGKTYGNECMRKAAGVQKDRDGECGQEG